MQKHTTTNNIKVILNRIKQLEGVNSYRALAKLFNIRPSTLYSWMRRDTFPDGFLNNYSRQKHINYDWLVSGEGHPEIARSVYIPAEKGLIPVLGIAEAGKGFCNIDRGYPPGISDEWISRPHGLKDPKAFGIHIEGNSMSPVYRHRQRIIVSPNININSGDRVIVVLKNDEAIICEIHFNDDKVTLVKFNADDIEVSRKEIKVCYKIVWAKEL